MELPNVNAMRAKSDESTQITDEDRERFVAHASERIEKAAALGFRMVQVGLDDLRQAPCIRILQEAGYTIVDGTPAFATWGPPIKVMW